MKKLYCMIAIVLSMVFLSGCGNGVDWDNYLAEPVAQSGDVAHYAELSDSDRKNYCEDKHIEVSGYVIKTGYSLFYIGDPAADDMKIMLRFDDDRYKLRQLDVGDYVEVHGICTQSDSREMVVSGCKLLKPEFSAATPAASADCEGKNYEDIVELFESAGYSNIVTKAIEVDAGDSQYADGDVIAVGSGSGAAFGEGEELDPEVLITIGYAVLKEAESTVSEPVRIITEAESTVSEPSRTITEAAVSISEDEQRYEVQDEPVTLDYVLNTNTKKFHYPSCKSVKQIKEKNRMDVTLSREEITAQGYVPCKNCNP